MNVSDPTKVEAIARFLYANIGNITSKASVAEGTGIPESTVGIYMKAMEEAFLILSCDRYDMVGKKLFATVGKYYVTDLGDEEGHSEHHCRYGHRQASGESGVRGASAQRI